MKLLASELPGCFQLLFNERPDGRGSFVKTFQSTAFRELGLEASFAESFYSISEEGVLRGMHFQMPPADGAKLIYCLQGAVMDVALDLRVGSPTFGRCTVFQLSCKQAAAAYIPRGVAHGFISTDGPATLVYHVSSEYDRNLDSGILWSSLDIEWPISNPILSERDHSWSTLQAFRSPFRFAQTEVNI